MLIYIIPFVLLLVVAIVLKKRESAQQNNETKKAQPLKGNKKAKRAQGKSTSTSTTSTTVTTPSAAAAGVETEKTHGQAEVNSEFRRRIETLIQEQNFSTAEALLNQELNQNKDQHDLYLLLLDVHLKQQDNFGVTQLLNHLKSLKLFDLVRLAEQKCALEKVKAEAIQHTPVQLQESIASSTSTQENFADILSSQQETQDRSTIDFPSATQTTPSLSNVGHESPKQDLAPKPTEEAAPLDFDFSFSDLAKTEPKTKPVKNTEVSSTPTAAPLDFKLSLEPHSVETKGASLTAQATSTSTLDFDLTQSDIKLETNSKETKTEQIFQDVQPKSKSLDFTFDLETTTPAAPVLTSEAEPAPSVEQTGSEFTFDLPTAEVTPNVEVATVEPVSAEVPLTFETTATTVEAAQTPTVPDPILLQFPELNSLKESELDLRLAEQYVKLGAFDAARQLLAVAQTRFDAAESEQAKKLLNQIAS